MIAINDNYADGRDMSWLWDVGFESLAHRGVAMVSGVRTYDMALRLSYDGVSIAAHEPDLGKALDDFWQLTRTSPSASSAPTPQCLPCVNAWAPTPRWRPSTDDCARSL